MATKSKKSKAYHTSWKALAVLLFFICTLVTFICGALAGAISRQWNWDIIDAETVYDTKEFRDAFRTALDMAIMADIQYQSEEWILAGEAADRDEVIYGFKRYYNIIDGVISSNTEINETFDGLNIFGEIPGSLYANLQEYQYLVENRLPMYYQMYLQSQLDEYRTCIRYLDGLRNFLYFIEDASGHPFGGNTSRGEISDEEYTLALYAGFSSDHLDKMPDYFEAYSNPVLEESGLRFYGAIRDPLLPGDIFYELQESFGFAKQSLPILLAVFSAAALLMLACAVYLVRVTGQNEKGGTVQYLIVDRIYNEVHFFLVAALFGISAFGGKALGQVILRGQVEFWANIFLTILGALYLANFAVGLSYILSVARQIKGRQFFRNTWISVSIRRMSELFTEKTFRGWMLIVMLCYGLGNCVLMGLAVLAPDYGKWRFGILCGLALVLFNAFCIYLFLRALRSLKNIMISARETSKGDFSEPLDLTKISPSFQNFAADIAHIQDGLKNAVDDAVKGERMKTDLITNVSHDLKTPLTSIITYADLLKNEELANERAKGYIDVLYEKSYRLKQLIEDLIEASKASSGNLTVTKMQIDFRQLTLQAMGEMEEKIDAAGLTFKMSCPEPVRINADGRHMWRILENLFSNAIKYSMPNSRVYVDIFNMDGYGILVMKNISAVPIDFDETRLTERFVRGDTARTTEGSGLGLSITQSLAQIQDGTFGIQVDGDLFKSIVSIPLWEDEEEREETEEEAPEPEEMEEEAPEPEE